MIDLHCHVLPGIDDGARTLEEAVEMCRMAAAEGCEALVTTPHQRRGSWVNADRAALARLRQSVQEAVGAALRLHPGGEIHVDSFLLAEIESMNGVPAGDAGSGVLPLARSHYLLLELDDEDTPEGAEDLVHELAVAGWRPVLAHPEFVPWIAGATEIVARLVSLGAHTQVTAMSVTGDFGRRAQADTLRLLDAGLVHFVASDAHAPRRRPPGLKRAYEAVAARCGGETARRLFVENPRAVVEDRPLALEWPQGAAASRTVLRGPRR